MAGNNGHNITSKKFPEKSVVSPNDNDNDKIICQVDDRAVKFVRNAGFVACALDGAWCLWELEDYPWSSVFGLIASGCFAIITYLLTKEDGILISTKDPSKNYIKNQRSNGRLTR
jgi:hypothetical protein